MAGWVLEAHCELVVQFDFEPTDTDRFHVQAADLIDAMSTEVELSEPDWDRIDLLARELVALLDTREQRGI